MAYFNDITRLPLAQFRAFHAVICEYERIATYLVSCGFIYLLIHCTNTFWCKAAVEGG